MEICRPGRRTVSAQEFEPRRAAYIQLLSGDDAHQGGPAPPFCAALNNGAMHGPSLGDHLEQSGQCCAIVDWCSSEMDGGNDWLYITSRYREMHGWAPGKTVEEINAGTSDTFKRTLALVKVKAQYERAVHRFDMKTRKGMFQYTVVPVNYRYSADQEPIVATVIYKVKVSVGDRTQEELRRGACFDYSTDIISLYSPSGGVLVQNRRAEHFYATSPRFAAEFKKRETVDLLRLLFTESSAYDLYVPLWESRQPLLVSTPANPFPPWRVCSLCSPLMPPTRSRRLHYGLTRGAAGVSRAWWRSMGRTPAGC